MACRQVKSSTISTQDGNRAGSDDDASHVVTSSASGDVDSREGIDSRSGSGRAAFAETQRCIVMDVLRTDFDGLASSELTGEPAAAARQPDTSSAAPATECISGVAQDALDEVSLILRRPSLRAARVNRTI